MPRLADMIRRATRAVALTGAGVSTDSGVPDFRSVGGLWSRADPRVVASLPGLLAHPEEAMAFWRRLSADLAAARPSTTHRVLARLEAAGLIDSVITQNIDGLHQAAGSRRVIEVHGTWRRSTCMSCHVEEDTLTCLAAPGIPRCCRCGGLMRPDVVLFMEPLGLAFAEALDLVEMADLLVVLGTSLTVYPVADLVPRALRRGACVAIVDRASTPFDDLVHLKIEAGLSEVMGELARDLGLPD